MTRAADAPPISSGRPVSPGDPRGTPAMRQYARFKALHPDCVLFFRIGDFYEMFDDDARLAHRVLGITLTQRTEGIPMAGVPYHAVEGYLRRMIQAGYRVAVCDQVQDATEARGIVDRAVTRVVTPGTLVDESLLDESAANELAAIQFLESGDRSAAVLAVAELSTGSFSLIDLPADRVFDELARIAPSELLYVQTADGAVPPRVEAIRTALGCALTARPAWTFRQSDALEALCGHYGVKSLAGFGLAEDDAAVAPAGALLRYLQETGTPALRAGGPGTPALRAGSEPGDVDARIADDTPGSESRATTGLAHLRPPKRRPLDQFVIIDAASLASLEIERTMRSGLAAGSLLSILQKSRTPMGKRLLRHWLRFPLRDKTAIEQRHSAVATMIEDRTLAGELGSHLAMVQDVARIVGRAAMGRAAPRDLVALGASVAHVGGLSELLAGIPAFADRHARLTALSASLTPLAESIAGRCVDSPPAHMRDGGLFRDGVDAELDEARTLQRDGNAWLATYQKQLIDETSIPSLKVGYNKIFGYYIEITHTHTEKVPDTFSRRQTLRNAERYITPELKEFEDKVTTAEARAIERERLLFERLCRQAAAEAGKLADYAEVVAELDVLACFAEIALRFNYVRPTMVDEPMLDIRQGRHPVLDRMLGERFVPNDCVLGTPALRAGSPGTPALRAGSESDFVDTIVEINTPGSESRATRSRATLALITGPNMAGKSTFIRQVALIVLLAHAGCFVPAEAATIGLTDRIFTRIGASDELHAGQSTFMVEMTETANILHHATPASLVILDEIGRGTSTLDGLSLAWAIAESLAGRGCRTLFATHYHELTTLAETLPAVTNLHVSVREWGAPGNEQIIFLYRILPGRTDRSYGIHVAKIAGLPRETIRRASELLETLAVQTEGTTALRAVSGSSDQVGKRSTAATVAPGAQLGLFTEYLEHPVVDELRKLDLNALTPMQAFDSLRTLKDRLSP